LFCFKHYNNRLSYNYASYDQLIQKACSGDLDSEAAGAAVLDDVEHSPSVDLELIAADDTLQEGDDDRESVQSVLAKDDGGVEWPDVVGLESETATTTLTATGGRRLARDVDDDDDAVFGQLVVRELRHVNDPETKLLLRHNILTLIYEARLGCIQGARHPARPSLRRLDQGSRRPPTLSTVNGCRPSWRRAHCIHDDVDAADAAIHRLNHAVDDGNIVIKEEMG